MAARAHRLTSRKAQKAPVLKLRLPVKFAHTVHKLHGRKGTVSGAYMAMRQKGPKTHTKGQKGWHISPEARARRIGKRHPHRGYHGHRRKHHISPAALARRIGKHHHHKGHPQTASTRAKIAAGLKGRHQGDPRKTKRRT